LGELDWANLLWANLHWAKDHGIHNLVSVLLDCTDLLLYIFFCQLPLNDSQTTIVVQRWHLHYGITQLFLKAVQTLNYSSFEKQYLYILVSFLIGPYMLCPYFPNEKKAKSIIMFTQEVFSVKRRNEKISYSTSKY